MEVHGFICAGRRLYKVGRMSDLNFDPYNFKFEDIDIPIPKPKNIIERQNGVILRCVERDGCLRMDMVILDKLNVNINEKWGPIGQLPSLN